MTLLSDQPRLSDPPRLAPAELEAYWMPFTANRQFKSKPRMMATAEGMYYTTDDGRRILDGFAGLWCCNAGHGRKPIVEAIQRQAATMDYAPAFQMGHALAFELANRIVELAPKPLDHVFFCNSGSEAVDTALKIALRWQRARRRGAHAPHRPRARLPRRGLRRHRGRRHPFQPQDVRRAHGRRGPPASHPQHQGVRVHEGAARMGRAPGRRAG